MRVYIGGPISFKSFQEVAEYFNKYSKILSQYGFEVLHPMIAKGCLKDQNNLVPEGYQHPECTNHAIVERDNWMVAESDIVFFDFTQTTKISIGSMFELAWAYQLRKYVVVVMQPENPHWHSFVLEAADIVFPTSSEAIAYLRKLIQGEL
ncbi:MAG: nucleoside 2-deoxyribosyltransferase [Candidatus Pacebacteria bacterium]|nr:nucleoside 2-deoxyribosyltransferase [Candidatus Paceibacterota bacterium]